MEKALHDYLLSVDDRKGCECPAEFDRDKYLEEIKSLKFNIEKIANIALEIDEHVQDASFCIDLRLLKKSKETTAYLFAIRFSNFGRMFTIWVNDLPEKEKHDTQKVIEFLQSNGFIYIDADRLNEPYDGINDALKLAKFMPDMPYTWWIRYFDYL